MPIALSLLAPAALLPVIALAFARPGKRPGSLPRWSDGAAFAAFALALAGLVQAVTAPVPLCAFGLRADLVSATLASLVGLHRLDRDALQPHLSRRGSPRRRVSRPDAGDARCGAGVRAGRQPCTLIVAILRRRPDPEAAAAVLSRPARGTACRDQVRARLARGDRCCWPPPRCCSRFGTLDLAGLAAASNPPLGLAGTLGIGARRAAAALKTAAFPLHGWLTEVMEAPTPVSALLHAGIINSGGVLLITAAPLVQASTGAMAALVMIGGLTALFGAAVMLTQSAIKTALAWSTVSQMGFMLLQCGLGLWTLALLHIVAHSLYKAHAFLSSGGAVKDVASIRRPGPVAVPSVARCSSLRAGACHLRRHRRADSPR
jgi:NAD(P)H-quinone oxidoreductase subunit 5